MRWESLGNTSAGSMPVACCSALGEGSTWPRMHNPQVTSRLRKPRNEPLKAWRPRVDCFKYRNKIGLEVALEALRDCWRKRRATMDELWDAAKLCRMANVMCPYLESVT